jgi:hypothetical protein
VSALRLPPRDCEELFEEKTNLFAELLKGGPVTWQGKTRPSLRNPRLREPMV